MRAHALAAMGALSIALVLAGCSAERESPPPSLIASSATASNSVSPSEASEPAVALIGLWKVQAEGESDSTWVVFTAGGFTVERDRRLIDGSWATGDDQVLAMVSSWQGGSQNRYVRWLTSAHSFRRAGSSRLLLAEDGHVLATLAPTTKAPNPIGALPELMDPPTLSPTGSDALSRPTPAPSPGTSLDTAGVVGSWQAGTVEGQYSIPLLTLRRDGTYLTSDGCNGTGGRWRLISDNRILTTIGGSAGVGCAIVVDVPTWFAHTRTIGISGDRLTLYDHAGTALGSLDRA